MKRENSRDALLRAALELFAAKGYEAVSPNEIVERVGVTKPTLYHFFGSKEGLFDEVLRIHYEQLSGILEKVCVYEPHPQDYERDVWPVLLEVVRALFAFARANTDFVLLSLSMSFAPPSSKTAAVSGRYHTRQYEILEGLFHAFAQTHRNLRGKERASSRFFLAAVHAQIGLWHRGSGNLEEDDARAIVKLFLHGAFA